LVATAYVRKADGQNCTIKLPAGMSLAGGEQDKKPVKTEAGQDYAVVAWRIVASMADEFILESVLDDGANAKVRVRVVKDSMSCSELATRVAGYWR